METDHDAALNKVQSLARATGTPLPRELDLDHQVVIKQLNDVEPSAFDIEYIRSQIAGHQRTAKLLEYQIGAGQSEEVRDFAKETLVGVMEHLTMAKDIHAQLAGGVP